MSLATVLKEMSIGMVSCLIALSVVGLAYAPVLQYNQEKAQAIPVFDPVNWIQNAISAIYSAYQYVLNNWDQIKERYLDPAVWNIINLILQNMMRDTTAWINSGFAGRPAFMQNPDGFLTGIADGVVGSYLASTELGNFLCSTWDVDIRGVLALTYERTRNTAPECTVTGMWNNAQYTMNQFQQFVNGSFAQGGWDAWFQFSQNPQYNQHGSLLLAQEQLSLKITGSKGQKYDMVQSAQGFLSSEKCVPGETEYVRGPGGARYPVEGPPKCQTVTPGSTIEKTLNEQFAGGKERIQVADEFNELVAAFFSQMVQQALAQGVSDTLSPGPGNYYASGNSPNVAPTGNPIDEALAAETGYRAAAQDLFNRILGVATYKEDTYPPLPIYEVDFEGNRTGNILGYQPNNCHSGELTPALADKRDEFNRGIQTSITNSELLASIKTRYDAAVSGNRTEEQNQIMQEFLTLQGSGTLHSQADVEVLRLSEGREIDALINGDPNRGIIGFIPEVDNACRVVDPGGPTGGA